MSARSVKRPALLAVMASIAAIGGGAALAGVWRVGALLQAGPVLIVAEKQALAQALEDTPWFDPVPGGGGEAAVWLISRPDCKPCRTIERRLAARGVEVRLVLAAPRGVSGAEEAVVAELARRRDGFVFQEWLRAPHAAPPTPAGVTEVDQGPQAQAGYAEFARAAVERIAEIAAANGEEMKPPVLIWRRGVEWRLASEADADDLAFLQRDLEAAR